MKAKVLKALGLLIILGAAIIYFFDLDYVFWRSENKAEKPLVIKVEDFSVFLFESSEEVYRANVKDPKIWAGFREYTNKDTVYALHYNWLYDTYNKMDDRRRNQLKEIMDVYSPQQMSERLIQKEKQTAKPDDVLKFISQDRFFGKNRNTLVDFYSWYSANCAIPQYELVKPLLQKKVNVAASRVEDQFDIFSYMEKETGIKLKKKPEAIELMLNMRMVGASGFSRNKDSLYTIQWNSSPERIWAASFHEFSHSFLRTFTGKWTFKYMAGKLKKDERLSTRYKDDVPYTWEGWIEENLAEGCARYLSVHKGIASSVGEGLYIFDREYAQALLDGFDPLKTSLEDFTVKFLKKKYDL